MTLSLEAELRPYRERVERELRARLSVEGEEGPESVRRAMAHSLFAPGKRVRPLLAMLAHEAAGGDARGIDTIAAAIEMLHTYSLIHDDLPCMDDDDLRRGRPTCHVAYGEALALLAGDALLTRGLVLLGEAEGLPPERRIRLLRVIGRAIGTAGMIGGQSLDLAAEENPPRRIEEVEEIHLRKTGALLAASVLAGAVAAGAPPEAEERLALYGRRLGLAFQVADDLLDRAGAEEAAGKRLRKDEARGKATYPGLLGTERSRALAAELAAGAAEALPFDTKTNLLARLARFVVDRSG
ncbi:MAG: polyprenyl synthetase family protein [Candidatus Latescibacterota bacterium]|nr:MAG: polyprenyl synthetase family protein [Candidatus Latescibacterota bacterium]